ncbi:MAG: HEAT repeat domain-containing protein, partial [Phycisphaerales bacterium]
LLNPIRARLVDLAAAEALVKLGQESEIEPIRAALFAPPEQSELSIVACDALGRLRDERSRDMLERIVTVEGPGRRSPELRLAASKALVEIGVRNDLAIATCREYASDADPRIRAQVASVLAVVPTEESARMLAALVLDTDPTVKVSAAGGMAGFQASAGSGGDR